MTRSFQAWRESVMRFRFGPNHFPNMEPDVYERLRAAGFTRLEAIHRRPMWPINIPKLVDLLWRNGHLK